VTPTPSQLEVGFYSEFSRMRLIPELPGHTCFEPWLDELNLSSGMYVFPGINLDVPTFAYGCIFPEIAFFGND